LVGRPIRESGVILIMAAAIAGATLGAACSWSNGPLAVLIAVPCCGSAAGLMAGLAIHFFAADPDLERERANGLDAMVTALRRAARSARDDAGRPGAPRDAAGSPPVPRTRNDRRVS
jgi:hypothetical protein